MDKVCQYRLGGWDYNGRPLICGKICAVFPDGAPCKGKDWMRFISRKYCSEHAELRKRESDLKYQHERRLSEKERREKTNKVIRNKDAIIERLTAENAALKQLLDGRRRI